MDARHDGFTLVECVVALAVFGLLLALAVPGYAEWMQSLRLTAASTDLGTHLMLARSEAISRNRRVALCKSPAGQACDREARWEQGGILFEDANNNALRETTEPILRRLAPLPDGLRLLANAPVQAYVSYGPYGQARTTSGAFQAGTFILCQIAAPEARRIVINAGGRPRVEKVWLTECG